MKISSTSVRLQEIMKQRNLKQVDIVDMCKPYSEQYNIKMSRSSISQYTS